MKEIKRFQVRGIPDQVTRADFAGRIVDFWAPEGGSDSVLIAHDGQNIFDPRTATHLRQTWRLTQNAIRVAKENHKKPPLVIGIFHSSNKQDPYGRIKDLSPEDAFHSGMKPSNPITTLDIKDLRGNELGSSMGGLATLYAAAKFSDYFHTTLAFSPHWVLAGNPLVEYLIENLQQHPERKLWMSRGTKGLDSSYQPFQEFADELARKKGWHSNFVTKVYHRTGHNERSWSSYVDEALRFWLS
jgi:hypothetical protein